MGGTKILIGEVNSSGAVCNTRRFASDASCQTRAVATLQQALSEYLAEQPTDTYGALGVTVPGLVDASAQAWRELTPMNSEPVDLARALSETAGIPAYIVNDVQAAAMAELKWGIGQTTGNFVYLNVGTGIAGRIVSADRVLSGSHWDAGEIGHMVIDMDGEPTCICGRRGCVEAFASGLGMSNEAHRLADVYDTKMEIVEGERVSTEALLAARAEGDPLACAVIDRATRGIAALVMNMVRVADPDAVILGGGVTASDAFYQLVLDNLDAQTMRFVAHGVMRSKLNPAHVALIGGAAYVLDNQKMGFRHD